MIGDATRAAIAAHIREFGACFEIEAAARGMFVCDHGRVCALVENPDGSITIPVEDLYAVDDVDRRLAELGGARSGTTSRGRLART